MNRNIIILSALMLPLSLKGYGSTARSSIAADSLTEKALLRTDSLATDSASTTGLSGSLGAVTVRRRRPSMIRQSGAVNGITMGRDELFKAACCNLGESFTTNPAVDVSYSDATTGAKQIKLLGLSGKYVQLLTENIPDFRGAAQPYSLDYIPGPWLKSIDVSKGAASVKNGYESITGQINAGYLLPQDPEGVSANLYANTMSRMEANFDGNIHLSSRLSTEVLGHYQYNPAHLDHNDDGFLDDPNTRQYNVQNRWAYFSPLYIFHGGLSLINEDRSSGQKPSLRLPEGVERYTTDINTERYSGYMKHAFIVDKEHEGNIALMASASLHLQDSRFGHKSYYVNEKDVETQLIYETKFSADHSLSTGIGYTHDYLGQLHHLSAEGDPADRTRDHERENVYGGYAQYTYDHHGKVTAMAGLRVDYSDLWGTFLTPRVHLKWQVTPLLSLRGSAGKGYRTVHPLAEYNYLLASGRTFVVDRLSQEEAWNYGVSAALMLPVGTRTLKLNADYYYTHFLHEAVVDYDSNPLELRIADLDGKSYSHTFQVDASMEVVSGLTLLAAWRRNLVRETYGGVTREKPLQSRYKGLFTASYKTPLGLWQIDGTLQLNGGGRLPSGLGNYKAYEQLNLQVTRWFRHFSIYAGGENLTNRKQHHPIIGASDPWGKGFEPTLIYGPVSGAMAYVGVRFNFGKHDK